MNNTALILVFIDTLGAKREIRLDDPISELTEIGILATMNLIITKNIFAGDALVTADSAYIITTTTQEIFNQSV